MHALVPLASVLLNPPRALRPVGHPLALLLALWGALSLAACGGGGGGVLPGGGLEGYVFEGEGTDGNFSGRPLSGVQVRYESSSEVVTVTTDASGFFATGRTPSGPYTLHVIPPASAQAASQSVYGMTLAETGPVVRFYLPLRRPAGGPSRWTGNSPTSSVVGILRDQTYVRDPATSEVFRVYKRSFDEGTFWREPVFGGIVGGVERGGGLEEMLQSAGWRRLEESLSGLPGTWR